MINEQASTGGTAPPAADCAAILAMAGGFEVSFAFDESAILQRDYERTAPYRADGAEWVFVLEDTASNDAAKNDAPRRIVLQHILLDPASGHLTKHWRQCWIWQARHAFVFDAERCWRVHAIDADTRRGAWTQCVYEVDDAPRYSGTGRWRHEGGISTWTSGVSWRPLPRREYTVRKDYNALQAVNRHTITPGGWTHEQDNTKLVRDEDGAVVRRVVREAGFNDYVRTESVDFTPARDYWRETQAYWQRIRARWDGLLVPGAELRLKTGVSGMELIVPLFELAEKVRSGTTVSDTDIDALFARWVVT